MYFAVYENGVSAEWGAWAPIVVFVIDKATS